MKKARILMCLIAFSLIFACSTSVPVEVMKPSEVNMGSMKNIAILYFGYPALGYGDATVEVIIRNTIGRYLGYAYTRNSEQESVAKYATDKFISLLIKTDYFTILDPSNVQSAIIGANKLNLSPTELAGIIGADALITGSISYMNTDIVDREIELKDKDGNFIGYGVEYTKTAEIQVTYRVLEGATGRLVATKSFDGKRSATETEYRRLPESVSMYQQILNEILQPLPRQLVPYKVTEYRGLMNDETKDPRMEEINELVKKKFYEDARDAYLDIWAETENVAAGYNAAIMFEITGDIDRAIGLMSEVAKKTKNERALAEVKRLQRTKAESEAAADQL